MERWEVRPTPTAEDPDRHVLLFQGGPADVASLLKKFGAMMGRPSPSQAPGFNLSLALHRLKPDSRAKLESWLEQVAPKPAASAAAPAAPAIPEAPAAPPPPPTPVPAPAIPPLAPPPPPPEPAVTLAPPPPPTPVPEPAAAAAPPPPPAPEPAIPAPPPPVPEKPALVSLAPEAAPAAPPPPPPPPAPEPAPAALPASAPPPAVVAESPVAVELRPDWTMETLMVGAYNRFAHAAAASVVSSPGSMYNPLFLYGVPGTGKSHMLHAIAASLSKGLGGSVLLATTGSRLSRAVNSALARKSMAEIDVRVTNSKALLIDDIHLMAISDQNKDALAKIFKSFFDRQLQVVITSLYPPKALGALEEALKFSFSKGWSVDLKMPSPAVQKDLIASAADRSAANLANEDLAALHEKLSAWGYQDLTLWLKRITVLKKVREAAGQPSALTSILPLIYDPVLSGGAEAPKPPAGGFKPPPAPADAPAMAVIAPKGQEGLATLAAALFYEVGAKNGFPQAYRHVMWETYDAAVPFGVPFMIGELCARAGVSRAIIVGPPPDSPLGPRSAEVAHAVRRILESVNVEMAWIPYQGLQLGAHYLNAHLDLAVLPPKA